MSAADRSIERSTATSMAPASRTMMASNGSASRVMSDPKMEIVAAVQMRTNARLRQSGERNAELGKRTMAEDSGPGAACEPRPTLRYTRLDLGVARTRAPAERPAPATGTPLAGDPPRPCSTRSVNACARPSPV